MTILKGRRKDPVVQQAEQEELQKLSERKTYELVEDVGQEHETTTWVTLYIDEVQVRARLVPRRFEEKIELLIRAMCTHVNDFLHCGSTEFGAVMKNLSKTFRWDWHRKRASYMWSIIERRRQKGSQ